MAEMADLQITLLPGDVPEGTPVPVQVLDVDLETRWSGAVVVGRAETVSIAPSPDEDEKGVARFAVRASLPQGGVARSPVDWARGKLAAVEIPTARHPGAPGGQPRPQLAQRAALGRGQTTASESRRISRVRAPSDEAILSSVWVRLWVREPGGGRWSVEPWPAAAAVESDGLGRSYDLRLRRDKPRSLFYMQVGGPERMSRLTALPSDECRIRLGPLGAASRSRPEATDPIMRVSIGSTCPGIGALLSYLAQGDIDQARLVGERTLRMSRGQGSDVLKKPEGTAAAAALGYYLLMTRDLGGLKRLFDDNLDDWTSWLPDGAVIDAWRTLRSEQVDLRRARAALVRAALCGLPIYTRGLRFLNDGLRTLTSDKDQREEVTGPDVAVALERVSRFCAAADFDPPYTTFIGRDPETPGPTPLDDHSGQGEVTYPWRPAPGLAVSYGAAFGVPGASSEASFAGPPPGAAPPTGVAATSFSAVNALDAARRYANAAGAGSTSDNPAGASHVDYVARLLRVADKQTRVERQAASKSVTLPSLGGDVAAVQGLAVSRILGETDLVPTGFALRAWLAARAVARVAAPNSPVDAARCGTGILVSPRLMLVARSVLPDVGVARGAAAEFSHEDEANGELEQSRSVSLDPDAFFEGHPGGDLVLVAIAQQGAERSWCPLREEFGRALVGERLSFVCHACGSSKLMSIRGAKISRIGESHLYVRAADGEDRSGAPLFNDQWELVGVQTRRVPRTNDQGAILSKDGSVWTSGAAGEDAIDWVAHEALRASRIVRWLRSLTLDETRDDLRDEALYLAPPPPRVAFTAS